MGGSELSVACLICNKPNAKYCSRCKGASYCSEECQRADYAIHKLLCTGFSEFAITDRPTENHVRAIYFPMSRENPGLFWLEFRDDNGSKLPVTLDALRRDNGVLTSTTVKYNFFLKRRPSNTVCIIYRDSYSADGSMINKSIDGIIATWPGSHHHWRGPLVAYGMTKLDPGHVDKKNPCLNNHL
ncbi:hypothetical protein F5Y08DRAFT_352721 [Xylaria arbuscula]|nr:hypothetical protein F5Y08DRAFT_352721 [Xylaria arbuscula]